MSEFRTETDSLGEVRVPANRHWGAQTQRAVENFPVSGTRFPPRFIRSLALVKLAAAETNRDLGLLDGKTADAIAKAAAEVAEGRWDDEFPVDIYQTGSGTSTNMNANEVIASRANELLGGKKGDRAPVRPNDEVNKCQSSNDVIPAAIHLAVLDAFDRDLIPALSGLAAALRARSAEFSDVVKTGRTHLQDAVPITLGQEVSGWAAQVARGMQRIAAGSVRLVELPLGGTALGTGLNAHPEFGRRVCEKLRAGTGFPVSPPANPFEAMAARDALVEASAALKVVAVSLMKIAGDVRLLSCGPRAGLGELVLPALQPGSSIMPGKVNPVMPEMMIQVCAQVIGNDLAVTMGGALGQLDLNVMMPLMAHNILSSASLLASASRAFTEKCVTGMTADRDRCRALVERSLMPVTALVPKLGYKTAAEIAAEAHRTGKTVREVVLERKLIPEKELDALLDLGGMTQPGIREGIGGG
ncbi:MAG: class II fumarate hydratase [Candidatus Coatesbacteria bacterium]